MESKYLNESLMRCVLTPFFHWFRHAVSTKALASMFPQCAALPLCSDLEMEAHSISSTIRVLIQDTMTIYAFLYVNNAKAIRIS